VSLVNALGRLKFTVVSKVPGKINKILRKNRNFYAKSVFDKLKIRFLG